MGDFWKLIHEPTRLWIFFILFLSVSSSKADILEENFVKFYGNDPESSGMWEHVQNFSSDHERLKNLSLRAHKRANMLPTTIIETIAFENKTLSFSNPKFKPIIVNTIVYTIPPLPQNHLYICKGLAADCVFYLTQWDRHAKVFRIGLHFCGIEL